VANAELPAHLANQLAAAQNDTLRLLRFEGQLIGGEVTELDFAAMPEWVRLPMLETYVGWCTAGRPASTRPHPTDPNTCSPLRGARGWSPAPGAST